MPAYDRLPEHMRGGARRYIESGIPPGGFLAAVLGNDLAGAFSQADSTNLQAMGAWARWLHNDIPRSAWGSPAKVTAWCEAGGMKQLEKLGGY